MKLKAFLRTMLSLFLVGMLVLVSSLYFTVSPGQASETPAIRVSPSYIEVPQNTLFNASILIENMPEDPGVGGIEFKLTWNSSILNGVNMEEVLFSSVPPGEEDNIWQVRHEFSAGQVWYAYTYKYMERAIAGGYAPKSGNGTVAIITFNSTALGETDLHFSVIKIADLQVELIPTNSIDGAVYVCVSALQGDLNSDGIVDIFDAVILSNAFDNPPGDPGWNPNADLNGDQAVDIFDAIILSNNFDETWV